MPSTQNNLANSLSSMVSFSLSHKGDEAYNAKESSSQSIHYYHRCSNLINSLNNKIMKLLLSLLVVYCTGVSAYSPSIGWTLSTKTNIMPTTADINKFLNLVKPNKAIRRLPIDIGISQYQETTSSSRRDPHDYYSAAAVAATATTTTNKVPAVTEINKFIKLSKIAKILHPQALDMETPDYGVDSQDTSVGIQTILADIHLEPADRLGLWELPAGQTNANLYDFSSDPDRCDKLVMISKAPQVTKLRAGDVIVGVQTGSGAQRAMECTTGLSRDQTLRAIARCITHATKNGIPTIQLEVNRAIV